MPDPQLPEGTDAVLDEDGIEAEINEPDDGAGDPFAALDDEDEDLEQKDDLDDAELQAGADAGIGGNANAGVGANVDGGDLRSAFFGKFDELRGQATDRAFTLAQTGKDRATSALDDIVRTVEDAASEIDSKIGTQYGAYARKAAESIGGLSDSFKDKQVDELFADARELVKKSPAIAIGAAAALGFVVARLVKAGLPDSSAKDGEPSDGRAT